MKRTKSLPINKIDTKSTVYGIKSYNKPSSIVHKNSEDLDKNKFNWHKKLIKMDKKQDKFYW